MELPHYGVFCAAIAALWAYTGRYQAATLYWGKAIAGDAPLLPSTGMQDAITPKAQNTRNTITLISYLFVPALGVEAFSWPIGLGALVATYALTLPIYMCLPKEESTYFLSSILRSLADRRAEFERSSDSARMEAVDAMILQLQTAAERRAERAAV